MRVLVKVALLLQEDLNEEKEKEMWNVDIRLNEINCSSFLELFHAYTHTDAQTNVSNIKLLLIFHILRSYIFFRENGFDIQRLQDGMSNNGKL